MPYARYVACAFGSRYAGALANTGYALDGAEAWTPATEVLDPDGDPTGAVVPLVTFPDAYAGGLIFCPDTTATPKRYAFVAVNPGDDERTDAIAGMLADYDDLLVKGTVNDGSPSSTLFKGSSGLSSANNFYNGRQVCFTAGALRGLKATISAYVGATRQITISPGFPSAPANGDTFDII